MNRSNKTKVAIQELKLAVKASRNPLQAVEGVFSGRTALVVSAGPSAVLWREVYEREVAAEPVVVCVKQAISTVGALCDIHFVNSANVQRYRYVTPEPFIVFSKQINGYPAFLKHDLKTRVVDIGKLTLNDTIAYSRDFESSRLSASNDTSAWGPGIMYEAVFPMLVHMGFRRIVTVGWDIADSAGQNTHFYDTQAPVIPKSTKFVDGLKRVSGLRVIARPLYRGLLVPVNIWRHISGRRYNIAGMLSGEAELIKASVPALRAWLKKKGISLEIVSASSWHNARM